MMKKCLVALLAALLLVAVASACLAEDALRGYSKKDGYVYVHLGEYPQTAEGGVEPILWRVLAVDEEKAFLCSEYVLFPMPLHTNVTEYKKIGKDFGQTDLCAYLNSTFCDDAFKQGETALLLPFETFGKVFLLDSDDLKNKDIGMGVGEGLKGWATEYAKAQGVFVYRVNRGSHSPYWIRSQSTSDKRHGRCTKAEGKIGHIVSDRDNEGVRPAIHLDMSLVEIASGTGTMEDPFVLALPSAPDPDAAP